MRNRARFTVASVVSLAAASIAMLTLIACGDDSSDQDKVFPVEGGVPGPRDSSTPPKDTSPPEEEADAPVDAGCQVLPAQIEVINVPEDPNNSPIGGAIPDGTYALTSAVFADPTKDGGVAFKRAGFMQFAGKNVVWQFDTDADGKPQPMCCAGTWAYNNTEVMSLNMTCNGEARFLNEIYDYHPTGVPDGGAGKPQIMIHVGELHDIYTKQ